VRSLHQLIKAHNSFVVVRSWEDTTHVLDPADGVAVHVDAHSRVVFLADEQVARRIWTFVVGHVHCVHACQNAWQAHGPEQTLALHNFSVCIKPHTGDSADVRHIVLFVKPGGKFQAKQLQHRPRNVEACFQGVERLASCKSAHESSDSQAQWRYLGVLRDVASIASRRGGRTGFGVWRLGRIEDKLPTHRGGLVNPIKPCTGQPEKLTKARVGVGKASLDPVMPHGGLVPGQAPLRFAILAKLGLQETRDASGNLRAVGRWQGTPGICNVEERLAPHVFPLLLEQVGQPCSWSPQPRIQRRVHA
jgi:hypothetical protein